jgi:hypothetical protein
VEHPDRPPHRLGREPSARVRTETARRLLAVRADENAHAGHTAVDATGYRRRMQALVALGFPQAFLAERLGISLRSNFHIGAELVTAASLRRARAVYDELWDADPLALGVGKQPASRARNQAARRGWPPPQAWDDETIDDPAAQPDLGTRASRQDAVVENAEFVMRTTGVTDRRLVAARLGVTRQTLDSYLARAAKERELAA